MTDKIVSRIYRLGEGCCEACVFGKGPHSEGCEFIEKPFPWLSLPHFSEGPQRLTNAQGAPVWLPPVSKDQPVESTQPEPSNGFLDYILADDFLDEEDAWSDPYLL